MYCVKMSIILGFPRFSLGKDDILFINERSPIVSATQLAAGPSWDDLPVWLQKNMENHHVQ